MARNVIAVCEAVIRMILSTFFVEVVKITPFSGSIFFKGSKPFLTGTVCSADCESDGKELATIRPLRRRDAFEGTDGQGKEVG